MRREKPEGLDDKKPAPPDRPPCIPYTVTVLGHSVIHSPAVPNNPFPTIPRSSIVAGLLITRLWQCM